MRGALARRSPRLLSTCSTLRTRTSLSLCSVALVVLECRVGRARGRRSERRRLGAVEVSTERRGFSVVSTEAATSRSYPGARLTRRQISSPACRRRPRSRPAPVVSLATRPAARSKKFYVPPPCIIARAAAVIASDGAHARPALAHQDQKAYQCVSRGVRTMLRPRRKQPIFQNAKSRPGQKRSTRERRWYKDVGLGFKTPRTAIEGTFIGAWMRCRDRALTLRQTRSGS